MAPYIIARYRINTVDPARANSIARDICAEQTVEFPADLLTDGSPSHKLVGSLDNLETRSDKTTGDHTRATIHFDAAITGGELTRLLNLLFGAGSLKPGIRLAGIELPEEILATYPAPRLGARGLRTLCRAPKMPRGMPLIAHPALLGCFVAQSTHGMSPGLLFGTLMRLVGADPAIFPHAGGRFSLSENDCEQLAARAREPMGRLSPLMPIPA